MLRYLQYLLTIGPALLIENIPGVFAQSFCPSVNADGRTFEIVSDRIGKKFELFRGAL